MTLLKTLSVSLLASTFSSLAAASPWLTDYDEATALAAKENKSLLIDFTGSDWCHWCIKLNEEVFGKEEFLKAAQEKFVLLELDFPKDETKINPKTAAQNASLQQKYSVQGFPTILLTDAKGRPYAQTGYQEGGPEKYLESLTEMTAWKTRRDDLFANAEKAEGVEKAKLLHQGLQVIPEQHIHLYPEVIRNIVANDKEDVTGIGATQLKEQVYRDFEGKLMAALEKEDGAQILELVDSFIEKRQIEGIEKQDFLSLKVQVYIADGKFDQAEKIIEEIIAIDPETEIATGIAAFAVEQLPLIKEQAKAEIEAAKAEEKAETTPPSSE